MGRKLTASLLLVLLVFIYTEKAFHTHDKIVAAKAKTGISILHTTTSCAICDFTLTKDAALPLPAAIDLPVEILFSKYITAPVAYHCLPLDCHSDRGPPVA